MAALPFLWPCPLAHPEELLGGGEGGSGYKKGKSTEVAVMPVLLEEQWLAQVQWLAAVRTDPSTGKKNSVLGPWPGAVVGFDFINLIFKGIFESFSVFYKVPFPIC